MPRKYILAGGGTSGHINPALAIADEIKRREPDADILFCGTARGLESEMVPRAGFKFQEIRARGLPGKPGLEMIKAIREIMAGRKQCLKLLRSFKPDAVIGTGGYVCSPLISAAAHLKVPALLHEQNAYPGRSNRVMAGRCQSICVSFPGTERFFRTSAPVVLTGNPVREIFFQLSRKQARQELGIDEDQKLVLIMGGSLGAARLNSAVLGLAENDVWTSFTNLNGNVRLILAAGKQHFAAVSEAAEQAGLVCDVREYLFDAHLWMAAADLVIARAGAMTCSELTALGRASVLIPYPYAAGDHQTFNASVLVEAGAAIMQRDELCSSAWLSEILVEMLSDPSKLTLMGEAAGRLARPQAAGDIYSCLEGIIK